MSTSQTSNNAVPNGVRNGNGSSTITTGHSECTKRSRVFLLSAKDEQAARHMISNFRKYLADAHTSNEDAFLDNLAYTLCHRRSVFPWILAFPGSSIRGLIQAIDSCKSSPVKTRSHPRIGFVYTGQGAQWWAMGRELIDTYPVFKLTLLQCDAELKKLGATWNMIGMSDVSRHRRNLTNITLLQRSLVVLKKLLGSTSLIIVLLSASLFRLP